MPRLRHLRLLPLLASSALAWKGGLHSVRSKRSSPCNNPWKICTGFCCRRSSMAPASPGFACTMVLAAAIALAAISAPRNCQPYSRLPSSG
ncbi:hypothetical protein D3C86_1763360 [compost metagenome]